MIRLFVTFHHYLLQQRLLEETLCTDLPARQINIRANMPQSIIIISPLIGYSRRRNDRKDDDDDDDNNNR